MSAAEKEQKLPGLTLHLANAKRYELAGKQKVSMTVDGLIDDEVVWSTVEKMFINGFRVFTVDDFKGEMLNVFRVEVEQLEAKVGILQYDKDRLQRENDLLREELEQKRGVLDGFSRQFDGTGG